MSLERVRLAVVLDHPAQQFTRALQLLADEPGLETHVYYWSVTSLVQAADFGRSICWDVPLLEGYEWSAPEPRKSSVGRARQFISQFRTGRPQVVLCYGWASVIARLSIVYCLLTRTPILLYGDTTWQHSARGRHPIARAAMLRALMHVCAGAISTGAFNREFYIRYGMNPRRIWHGVCPADTEFFMRARVADPLTPTTGDGRLRIGFAGKLTARKGADELLRAAALLSRARDWTITVVGDGPLMPGLRELAAELGIDDRVSFHGFANTTEMPKLLAGFDIVVVPSRLDMRVLVTIEAMAAGAAIVVSDATAVWGPGDLVENEVTGLVYRSGDLAALAIQLDRLLDNGPLLASIRRNGAERAERFGPRSFAESTSSAVGHCLND